MSFDDRVHLGLFNLTPERQDEDYLLNCMAVVQGAKRHVWHLRR